MAINSKTRQLWAEKILDLVNIGAGALIFGQFLSEKDFVPTLIIAGIVLLIIGYVFSLIFLNKK